MKEKGIMTTKARFFGRFRQTGKLRNLCASHKVSVTFIEPPGLPKPKQPAELALAKIQKLKQERDAKVKECLRNTLFTKGIFMYLNRDYRLTKTKAIIFRNFEDGYAVFEKDLVVDGPSIPLSEKESIERLNYAHDQMNHFIRLTGPPRSHPDNLHLDEEVVRCAYEVLSFKLDEMEFDKKDAKIIQHYTALAVDILRLALDDELLKLWQSQGREADFPALGSDEYFDLLKEVVTISPLD